MGGAFPPHEITCLCPDCGKWWDNHTKRVAAKIDKREKEVTEVEKALKDVEGGIPIAPGYKNAHPHDCVGCGEDYYCWGWQCKGTRFKACQGCVKKMPASVEDWE